MADIPARLKLRTGTSAAWTSANPVLAAGEPGFESDTKVLRIGDGSTAFLSLDQIKTTDGFEASFQPINDNLQSLSGLTLSANKVLISTGIGALALAEITTAGLAILDDQNAAAQRVTLGLGAAALLGISNDVNFTVAGTSLADRATIKTFVDAAIAVIGTTIPAAVAAITHGAIGSYVFARCTTGDVAFGANVAGSNLRPISAAHSWGSGGNGGSIGLTSGSALTGTWRCMGSYDDANSSSGADGYYLFIGGATLWQRIA